MLIRQLVESKKFLLSFLYEGIMEYSFTLILHLLLATHFLKLYKPTGIQSVQLHKPTGIQSVQLHFLSTRCINVWNYLEDETRSSTSILAFKNSLVYYNLSAFFIIFQLFKINHSEHALVFS